MTIWTYIAQIINFIIFVVVMYYLLYRPVRKILKERRDEMEGDLRKAERLREEADKVRIDAQQRLEELEKKQDDVIKEARRQAEAQRREILDKAEQQGKDRLARFRNIMEQERTELLENVSAELRETIIQVAGAALDDASEDLTERGIQRLSDILDKMSDEDKKSALEALKEAGGKLEVLSASSLDKKHQDKLAKLLADKLGTKKLDLEVKEDASLLAGFEITLGTVRLEAHWRGVVEDALKAKQ